MAEMSDFDKKILQDVEFFKDRYFVFDEPIPICGINLYPVSLREYTEFMASMPCLTLNKNDDINGIKRTNIGYLLYKIKDKDEGPVWAMRLTKILEICMHIKPGFKCSKCGKYISYEEYMEKYMAAKSDDEKNKILKCECGNDKDMIASLNSKIGEDGKEILIFDGHDITNENFNKIRKYIMYQNLPDFKDDSWVDKSIRDDQMRRNELQSKNGGSASLERKIICMTAATSYTLDEIYNMSMRKFLLLVGAVSDLMEYKITKQGLMSGMVKLKDGQTLEHWLYKKDTGMYGSAVDTEGLVGKINSL